MQTALAVAIAAVFVWLGPGRWRGPRSHAHWAYVGLEVVTMIALLITGVWLLIA